VTAAKHARPDAILSTPRAVTAAELWAKTVPCDRSRRFPSLETMGERMVSPQPVGEQTIMVGISSVSAPVQSCSVAFLELKGWQASFLSHHPRLNLPHMAHSLPTR
jgi:hypothetical protein